MVEFMCPRCRRVYSSDRPYGRWKCPYCGEEVDLGLDGGGVHLGELVRVAAGRPDPSGGSGEDDADALCSVSQQNVAYT